MKGWGEGRGGERTEGGGKKPRGRKKGSGEDRKERRVIAELSTDPYFQLRFVG